MNAVDITIPSDHVFERIARDSAGVVARYLGLAPERTADLQLAVSEAVTNAIEHGNQGRPEISVGVQFLLAENRLTVRVVDQGGRMPALLPAAPLSLDDKLTEESPRGLGLYLIHRLVDGVALQTDEGRTEFTMWFDLQEPER